MELNSIISHAILEKLKHEGFGDGKSCVLNAATVIPIMKHLAMISDELKMQFIGTPGIPVAVSSHSHTPDRGPTHTMSDGTVIDASFFRRVNGNRNPVTYDYIFKQIHKCVGDDFDGSVTSTELGKAVPQWKYLHFKLKAWPNYGDFKDVYAFWVKLNH